MDIGTVAQHDFAVVSNMRVAQGIWRLVITSDVAHDIKPGQFMNLHVPGDGSHILRIPLSFKCADPVANTVELLYAVVGEGTERLSHMREGEVSTLLGPCGKGWWLPKEKGRSLLVAGGIGLPPVLAAARMLADASMGFDIVIGARTRDMLVFGDIDEVMRYGQAGDGQGCAYDPDRKVILTTDDGSVGYGDEGCKAFTTDAMADLMCRRTYGQIYTCGPTVMMAGVSRLAQEHDAACQVSMERMMGCGFGACACCNVALKQGGYALCCQDGPVFDAEEVAW